MIERISKERVLKSPGGGWYLVYTSFDSMENSVAAAESEVYTPLVSVSEKSLVIEAKEILKLISPYRAWNGQVYPKDPYIALIDPIQVDHVQTDKQPK